MLIALLQPLFFHPTLLNLWQPLIFLHFYNCVISRMLLKWNHSVCNSLRLALFTQHSSLEVVHVIACMTSSFLFIPWYRCTKVYSPIRGYLMVSSFWLLEISCFEQ